MSLQSIKVNQNPPGKQTKTEFFSLDLTSSFVPTRVIKIGSQRMFFIRVTVPASFGNMLIALYKDNYLILESKNIFIIRVFHLLFRVRFEIQFLAIVSLRYIYIYKEI